MLLKVRQAKPGGVGSHVKENATENFWWNPAGVKPARQRLATSRNRVLRGPGATLAAKRTQGVARPCDWASKRIWIGGRHCFQSGRQQGSRRNAWRESLRGV